MSGQYFVARDPTHQNGPAQPSSTHGPTRPAAQGIMEIWSDYHTKLNFKLQGIMTIWFDYQTKLLSLLQGIMAGK